MTCTRVPNPYRIRASPSSRGACHPRTLSPLLAADAGDKSLGRDLAEASSRLLPTPLDLGVVDTAPLIEVPVPPYVLDLGTPEPGEALDPLSFSAMLPPLSANLTKYQSIVRAGEAVCQKDNPAPDDNGSETCAR